VINYRTYWYKIAMYFFFNSLSGIEAIRITHQLSLNIFVDLVTGMPKQCSIWRSDILSSTPHCNELDAVHGCCNTTIPFTWPNERCVTIFHLDFSLDIPCGGESRSNTFLAGLLKNNWVMKLLKKYLIALQYKSTESYQLTLSIFLCIHHLRKMNRPIQDEFQ